MLGPEVRDLWTYIGGWGWVTGLLMGEESLQAVMGSRISKAAGVLVMSQQELHTVKVVAHTLA